MRAAELAEFFRVKEDIPEGILRPGIRKPCGCREQQRGTGSVVADAVAVIVRPCDDLLRAPAGDGEDDISSLYGFAVKVRCSKRLLFDLCPVISAGFEFGDQPVVGRLVRAVPGFLRRGAVREPLRDHGQVFQRFFRKVIITEVFTVYSCFQRRDLRGCRRWLRQAGTGREQKYSPQENCQNGFKIHCILPPFYTYRGRVPCLCDRIMNRM